jgi:hypothetical protein
MLENRARSRSSAHIDLKTSELYELFRAIDTNEDNIISRNEFVSGLVNIPYIDVSETEASRWFDNLDTNGTNSVTYQDFLKSSVRWRWLRSVVATFLAFKECTYTVPPDYEFTKETCVNHSVPAESAKLVGEFIKIRQERDYSFHNHYTPERQLWQVCMFSSWHCQ